LLDAVFQNMSVSADTTANSYIYTEITSS